MFTEPCRIDNFHQESYRFLSNFYMAPVTYKGYTFRNAEAAFQAQKCANAEDVRRFTSLSAKEAKALGRKVSLIPSWEEDKVRVMREVVKAKFLQNETLKEWLLATGDAELIEGNTWGDTYWGVDVRTGKGRNFLGKILMEVRDTVNNP